MTISPTQRLVASVSNNEEVVYCYVKEVKTIGERDKAFSAAILASIPSTCSPMEFRDIKNNSFCLAKKKKENSEITEVSVKRFWFEFFQIKNVTQFFFDEGQREDLGDELSFNDYVECGVLSSKEEAHITKCEKLLNQLNGRVSSNSSSSLVERLKSMILGR